jgi:hypothetical protein
MAESTTTIYWEQKAYTIDIPTDFVSLLNDLGVEGVDALLSVLMINYRENFERVRKQILTFEKAQSREQI